MSDNETEHDDDHDDNDDHDDEANDAEAPTAVAVCEFLCRSVVEAPDEVEIDVSDTRGGFRLDVHVGQGDMGRVIGKRGRVANAIRTVVGAAAAKDGVEVEVEFID